MKTVFKMMVAMLIVIAFSGVSAFAQTEETIDEPIRERARIHMTDEQKGNLQQNRNSENRQALRETFTEEQLVILQNMEMTREERREALRATFSEEQLALIEANQQARQAQREAFRNTLSEGQGKANQQARQAQREAFRNTLSDEQIETMKQNARQKGNGKRNGGN